MCFCSQNIVLKSNFPDRGYVGWHWNHLVSESLPVLIQIGWREQACGQVIVRAMCFSFAFMQKHKMNEDALHAPIVFICRISLTFYGSAQLFYHKEATWHSKTRNAKVSIGLLSAKTIKPQVRMSRWEQYSGNRLSPRVLENHCSKFRPDRFIGYRSIICFSFTYYANVWRRIKLVILD